MERVFAPEQLDTLFEATAQKQYTRELLFSTVVNLMSLVVCNIRPSVSAAYKAFAKEIGVSRVAFYSKINGIEPQVSQALVRYSAVELAPIINELGAQHPPLLPGYRLKIVDGNSLGATDHRLEVLRYANSGPLPGKSLVVLDPQLMMAIDALPCEDAYTQERALLNQVLPTVEPKDLWIGDRNLCTRSFLVGIAQRQACFVIRQHQSMPLTELDQITYIGESPTGEVFEQLVQVTFEGEQLIVRRVVVKLKQPTRDGDPEVAVLTNLPASVADGLLVGQLYLKRWTVEGMFQVITDTFHCEIKTLGYPKAALFAFCMALVAYNILAVVKAALGSVHGIGKIDAGISNYYLVEEIQGTYRGMMIAIPASVWEIFGQMSLPMFCTMLQQWASQVDLQRFSSTPRGRKKSPPQRQNNPHRPHVSTARLLAQSPNSHQSP